MNKKELTATIAEVSSLSQSKAEEILNTILQKIAESLKNGKSVKFVGFGNFSVSKREARKGRNPQTGEEINIPAKKLVKFKPGKALSAEINNG